MDLYYMPGSAPCRAVQLTAASIGIELNLKLTNLMAGDHKKPEFIQLNPQHCLPTLVDGDFALWESRAICAYLAEKYGRDSLYPKDPRRRAVVNQRLYFDHGMLYQRFADYYHPQLFGRQPPNEGNFKKMQDAVQFLNTFLTGQRYVAGETLTIADLHILATIANYDVVGFDLGKYPEVLSWYENIRKETPGAAMNLAGAKEFLNYT